MIDTAHSCYWIIGKSTCLWRWQAFEVMSVLRELFIPNKSLLSYKLEG